METNQPTQSKEDMLPKIISDVATLPKKVVIKNDEELAKASDIIAQVKKLKKLVEAEKEAYTNPAKEIVAKAKSIYDPHIKTCNEVEAEVKSACGAYMMEKERKRKEAEARLEKKLEEGKIKKPETVAKHLSALPEAKRSVSSGFSSVRMVMLKKLEITDEALLPREYLIPDTKKIEQVLRAGVAVPGAHLIEVPSMSSYGR